MCKKDSKIHLCTCGGNSNISDFQIHNNINFAIVIKWKLSRLIKNEWIGMDGMFIEPVNQFSSKITADFLCYEMNNSNCFDFEYIPKESDTITFDVVIYKMIGRRNLTLKKTKYQERKFIALIFKDQKWTINTYDPFYNTLEAINEGYLRLLNEY